jgi:hypothetical protein
MRKRRQYIVEYDAAAGWKFLRFYRGIDLQYRDAKKPKLTRSGAQRSG